MQVGVANLSKGERIPKMCIFKERERESLASAWRGWGGLMGLKGWPMAMASCLLKLGLGGGRCVCVCVCMRSSTHEAFHESLRRFLIKMNTLKILLIKASLLYNEEDL